MPSSLLGSASLPSLASRLESRLKLRLEEPPLTHIRQCKPCPTTAAGSLYVYIYVCIYTYIVYVFTYMYIHICYMCMYVCIYVYLTPNPNPHIHRIRQSRLCPTTAAGSSRSPSRMLIICLDGAEWMPGGSSRFVTSHPSTPIVTPRVTPRGGLRKMAGYEGHHNLGGYSPGWRPEAGPSNPEAGPVGARNLSECTRGRRGVRPVPPKVLRGGISKSILKRPCQFLAINAHKMAPRTNQWLQERTWDTPTYGLLWLPVLELVQLNSTQLVEMSCSTQLNKDSQNDGTGSTQLNSTTN